MAMKGRRPRLNGRTRKLMNSIGAISSLRMNGVSFGTNSEKKCSPCFQKPTPSTIAKLMIDITPVTVNWLVTVNGWAPDDRERHRAEEIGEQDEDEGGEDPRQIGAALRPDRCLRPSN